MASQEIPRDKRLHMRILWIGAMYFYIGLNYFISGALQPNAYSRRLCFSLGGIMIIMALLSWILERRKEMCSIVYVILITIVYFVHIPILLKLGNIIQYLILEYGVELSIISIVMLILKHHWNTKGRFRRVG